MSRRRRSEAAPSDSGIAPEPRALDDVRAWIGLALAALVVSVLAYLPLFTAGPLPDARDGLVVENALTAPSAARTDPLDAGGFHPFAGTRLFNDLFLVHRPLAALAGAVGAPPYPFVVVGLVAFAAVAVFFFARLHGVGASAAAGAAFLVPLASPFTQTLEHPQMHAAGLLVALAAAWTKALRDASPRWLAATTGLGALLLGSSVYLALYAVPVALCVLLVEPAGPGRLLARLRTEPGTGPLVFLLLASIAVATFLAAYGVLERELSFARDPRHLDLFDLDLEGLLIPVAGQGWTSALVARAPSPEGNLYLGVLAILALLATPWLAFAAEDWGLTKVVALGLGLGDLGAVGLIGACLALGQPLPLVATTLGLGAAVVAALVGARQAGTALARATLLARALALLGLWLAAGSRIELFGEPIAYGAGPWLHALPGFRGLRAAGRFGTLGTIGGALATAVVLERLHRATRHGVAIGVGIVAIAALDLWPSVRAEPRPPIPTVYATLGARHPGAVVLAVPNSGWSENQVRYQFFANQSGLRSVNGYGGILPPLSRRLLERSSVAADAPRVARSVEGLDFVVVDGAWGSAESTHELVRAFEGAGFPLADRDGRSHVFAVTPGPPAAVHERLVAPGLARCFVVTLPDGARRVRVGLGIDDDPERAIEIPGRIEPESPTWFRPRLVRLRTLPDDGSAAPAPALLIPPPRFTACAASDTLRAD